jgi:hypothetical protein
MEKRVCLIVDDLGGYIVSSERIVFDPSAPDGDPMPCYRTLTDAQIAAHHDGYTHFRRSSQGKTRQISRECQAASERPIPTRLNRATQDLD